MSRQGPRAPIAIENVPWQEWGEGIRFRSPDKTLSNTRGDEKRTIGVSYEELPPGKQSVPFHYHVIEEERIVALEGEATLRLGDERHTIKADGYMGFPVGLRGLDRTIMREGEHLDYWDGEQTGEPL